MVLKRGDRGDDVKEMQRRLNKLGSLLVVDGDFGGSSEAAVLDARSTLKLPVSPQADDALMAALAALAEPSEELTAPGVAFIGREEVSSPEAYRKSFKFPVWPGQNSGITIGIGYDLKFADAAKVHADWDGLLPSESIARLIKVSGTTGSDDLLDQAADVEVPLLAAVKVFVERMLPEHIRLTKAIYPTLGNLPPSRRTPLISLVLNRGNDLSGDRRREMKRIQELLAAGNLNDVADQFESMTRLWNPATAGGLIARRQREAKLWREGFAALQLA
jgi:peptidoglycan hydrolase-like protein with peptidoglycan-binding domain